MKTFLHSLALSMGLVSAPAVAVTLEIESATIGRAGSTTASIEIKVLGLTSEDRNGATDAQAFFEEKVKFFFTAVDGDEEGCADAELSQDKPILYAGGVTDGTFPGFVINNLDVGDGFVTATTSDGETTYYIDATMTLAEQSGSCGFDKLADEGKIAMEVIYNEDEKTEDFELVQQVGVPKVAPAGFKVEPSHLALLISWTHKDKVSYEPTGTSAPSNVMVFAVDTTMHSNLEFDAKIFNATVEESEELSSTCRVELEGDGCRVSCDDDKAYIDVDAVTAGNGLFKAQFPNAESPEDGYEISGLTLDHPYAVFAMYQPDGIARTSCVMGTPTYVDGICDRNKCNESKQTDPKCFVATAAYGTPFHSHLDILRWFRDTYLAKTELGRDFIRYYYEVGPGWAKAIEDSPAARAVVRGTLWPVVMILMLLQYSPMVAYSVLGVFGIILVYSCARLRRLRI
jgi:hypothetical protein